MFLAYDECGRLVNLLEGKLDARGLYTCPACQGVLVLKQGNRVRAHFAHRHQQSCQFFQEAESAEHLGLKASLYRSLRASGQEVKVEVALPALGQVADLLVNDRLVLEVQCSRLSLDRLAERTQAYRQAGYEVIWLLGEKLWLGRRATGLHGQVAALSQTLGVYLWEADLVKEEMRLRYLLHETLDGRVLGLVKRASFRGDLLEFLRQPYTNQVLESMTVALEPNPAAYVQRQLYYRNPKWLRRQAQVYQAGGNLLTWSTAEFYPQVRPLSLTGPGFATYWADFESFYQELGVKDRQTLYPPRFYAIMKKEVLERTGPGVQ